MQQRSRSIPGICAALAMGILILDNQFAMQAAAEGVQMCIHTVLPALFPFFVLSSVLASSMKQPPNFFLQLFRVSPTGGKLLLTGLLGGYPVGIKTISEAYRDGRISKSEAERLLPICNQCGPAFIFGITIPLFSDIRFSLMLWGIQLVSVLLVSWTIPSLPDTGKPAPSGNPVTWQEAMCRALGAISTVCGWIILFRLLIQFLNRWFLWRLPTMFQIALSGILELTNGCLALGQAPESYRFLLCTAFISLGGLCVTMQSFGVLHPNLKHGNYFPGKILQTAYSILLVSLLQQALTSAVWISGFLIIVCVVFFRKEKIAVAFQKKLLYNGAIKDTRERLCSSEKR